MPSSMGGARGLKQWTRAQIMKGLQKLVTEIDFMCTTEEFNGEKGGIWTSADNAWIFKGLPPFDYHVEFGECPLSYAGYTDPKYQKMKVKEMYVNGIHREIYSWLEERGWYPKWHDAGTLFFFMDLDRLASDVMEDLANHSSSTKSLKRKRLDITKLLISKKSKDESDS